MRLYFDGGCIPNPGKMEVAVVSDDGSVREHAKIHDGTNNEAEWFAFLWAVEIAQTKGWDDLTISGDSALVINQAQGLWRINAPNLQHYKKNFDEMRPSFKSLKLVHVRRHLNPAGIYIEQLQSGRS